jgi:hypothetical protein
VDEVARGLVNESPGELVLRLLGALNAILGIPARRYSVPRDFEDNCEEILASRLAVLRDPERDLIGIPRHGSPNTLRTPIMSGCDSDEHALQQAAGRPYSHCAGTSQRLVAGHSGEQVVSETVLNKRGDPVRMYETIEQYPRGSGKASRKNVQR